MADVFLQSRSGFDKTDRWSKAPWSDRQRFRGLMKNEHDRGAEAAMEELLAEAVQRVESVDVRILLASDPKVILEYARVVGGKRAA